MGCTQSSIVETPDNDEGDPKSNDPLLRPGDIFVNIDESKDIEMMRLRISEIVKIARKNSNSSVNKKIITKNALEEFLVIGTKKSNKVEIAVNQSIDNNPLLITNLIGLAIDMHPQKEVSIRAEGQKVKNFGFLKAFIYLYTGDYFYEPIRKLFTLRQNQKAYLLLSGLKKEIELIRKNNPEEMMDLQFKQDREIKANKSKSGQFITLFRGIAELDKKISASNDLYAWRAFSSTSLKSNIAQKFGRAKRRGQTIYRITLNQTNPHDHLIIPKQLSQYPDQDEVLLFPMFQFICTNKISDPSKYTIDLEQYDESRHKIIALPALK